MLTTEVWRAAGTIMAIVCLLTAPGALLSDNVVPGVLILVSGIVLAGVLYVFWKDEQEAQTNIARLSGKINLLERLAVEKGHEIIFDELRMIEAIDAMTSKLELKT